MCRAGKATGTEDSFVVARGMEGWAGGVMVKGYRVPLRDEKIVLKLDDGDGCTPL